MSFLHSSEQLLVANAVDLVETLMERIHQTTGKLPCYGTAELSKLSMEDIERALNEEAAAYRSSPKAAALYFCLKSASHLLQVSSALAGGATPPEEPGWSQPGSWIEDTKAAGRAAYRAATILAESGRQLH